MEMIDQTRKEIVGNFTFRFDAFISKNTHTKKDVMSSLGFPVNYVSMIGNELQRDKVPKKFWVFLKELNDSYMKLDEFMASKGITVTKAPKENHLPPREKKQRENNASQNKKGDSLTQRRKDPPGEVQIDVMEAINHAIKYKVLSQDMTVEVFQALVPVLEKDDRYQLCRAIIDTGMEEDELRSLVRYVWSTAFPDRSMEKVNDVATGGVNLQEATPDQLKGMYKLLSGRSKEEIDALLKMAISGPAAQEAGEALRKTVKLSLELTLVVKLNGKPIPNEQS